MKTIENIFGFTCQTDNNCFDLKCLFEYTVWYRKFRKILQLDIVMNETYLLTEEKKEHDNWTDKRIYGIDNTHSIHAPTIIYGTNFTDLTIRKHQLYSKYSKNF